MYSIPPIGHTSDTRQRILHAAATEFAENGFRATSMNTIAQSAGLNEVTVYRYFPKKQQLYWDAVDFKLRGSELFAQLLDVFQRIRTPNDVVRGLGETIIEVMQRDPAIVRLMYFTVLELEDEKRLLVQMHLKPFLKELTGRILSWIQSGEIRAVDPESAANSILGALLSHAITRGLLDSGSDNSSERIAAEYADICMRGLQQSGSPSPVAVSKSS